MREMRALLTGFTKDQKPAMKVCSKRLCADILTPFNYSGKSKLLISCTLIIKCKVYCTVVRLCSIHAHFTIRYIVYAVYFCRS